MINNINKKNLVIIPYIKHKNYYYKSENNLI